MKVRHSKAYERLAVIAGKEAGLAKPTAEKVAADEAARQLRDSYWLDYERRLADTQTYSIDKVHKWLAEIIGVKIGRSSIHRDRRAMLQTARLLKLRAELARNVVERAAGDGEGDVLRAARILAGQEIFRLLNLIEVDPESMKPGHVIGMIDVLGRLSKQHVETDILAAKLADLHKAAKDEIDKATAGKPDKKLTRQNVYEILDRIMKGTAA